MEKEQTWLSFNPQPFRHISRQSDKSQMFIQKLHSFFGWLVCFSSDLAYSCFTLLDLHLNSVVIAVSHDRCSFCSVFPACAYFPSSFLHLVCCQFRHLVQYSKSVVTTRSCKVFVKWAENQNRWLCWCCGHKSHTSIIKVYETVAETGLFHLGKVSKWLRWDKSAALVSVKVKSGLCSVGEFKSFC